MDDGRMYQLYAFSGTNFNALSRFVNEYSSEFDMPVTAEILAYTANEHRLRVMDEKMASLEEALQRGEISIEDLENNAMEDFAYNTEEHVFKASERPERAR